MCHQMTPFLELILVAAVVPEMKDDVRGAFLCFTKLAESSRSLLKTGLTCIEVSVFLLIGSLLSMSFS